MCNALDSRFTLLQGHVPNCWKFLLFSKQETEIICSSLGVLLLIAFLVQQLCTGTPYKAEYNGGGTN